MKMNHSITEPKEIIIMMIIMFIAGLLSSMNVWVNKISDIQLHLNDIYMSLLMCGWMLVIMGIYYINSQILLIGIIFTFIMIYCIRTQIFIDENQYLKGMIPHHSMAVLMSRELLNKEYNKEIHLSNDIKKLAKHIINSQNYEINFMKSVNQTYMKYV
jgi:hypothetical protein